MERDDYLKVLTSLEDLYYQEDGSSMGGLDFVVVSDFGITRCNSQGEFQGIEGPYSITPEESQLLSQCRTDGKWDTDIEDDIDWPGTSDFEIAVLLAKANATPNTEYYLFRTRDDDVPCEISMDGDELERRCVQDYIGGTEGEVTQWEEMDDEELKEWYDFVKEKQKGSESP